MRLRLNSVGKIIFYNMAIEQRLFVLIVLCICTIVPLSITSFVAIKNYNYKNCEYTIMHLSNWLLVNSIVNLVYFGVFIGIFILILSEIYIYKKKIFSIVSILILSLYIVFNFIWIIIGFIIVCKDILICYSGETFLHICISLNFGITSAFLVILACHTMPALIIKLNKNEIKVNLNNIETQCNK